MAGKIDKSHTHFLRAVNGNEWELWNFSENKNAQFVRRLSTPSEVPGELVVSLPAEYTFTFPAWLATSDRAVIPEILLRVVDRPPPTFPSPCRKSNPRHTSNAVLVSCGEFMDCSMIEEAQRALCNQPRDLAACAVFESLRGVF